MIIYGAGDIGRDLYTQCVFSGYVEIVAWVDDVPEKYQYIGYSVEGVDRIGKTEFDHILLCPDNAAEQEVMEKRVKELRIMETRIIHYRPESNKEHLMTMVGVI